MIGEPQAILYQAENDTVHFVEKKELNSEYHFKYSLKEDNQHSPKMFVIEGNIGVGKTTLARSLAKKMRCKPFLEPALENPFLERFYDDPHKYAMKLQMWIFRQRYRTYLEAVKYMKATGMSRRARAHTHTSSSSSVFAYERYRSQSVKS